MITLNLSDFYSGIFHFPKKIPGDRELHSVRVLVFLFVFNGEDKRNYSCGGWIKLSFYWNIIAGIMYSKSDC